MGRRRQRLLATLRALGHGMSYARHLARGNKIAGELSWTHPDHPPVLLAHGFLGTRGSMLPLTKRLQGDGRVVFSYHYGTFQLRSLRASAHQFTEHLRALHRDLRVPHVDAIGFSMGGLVALYAVKYLDAHRWLRRLVLLGAPLQGSWAILAAVATMGVFSSSAWQILPRSQFLEEVRNAPMPPGLRIRQIHATGDVLCPLPPPLAGIDRLRDYIVLPGGHASLVVAPIFYKKVHEFLQEQEEPTVIVP